MTVIFLVRDSDFRICDCHLLYFDCELTHFDRDVSTYDSHSNFRDCVDADCVDAWMRAKRESQVCLKKSQLV